MFDVLIAGAGISGAVLAENFAHDKKVLLIEKRQHIGGNCYDEIDGNGILIHRYGPHLFHTDNAEVWNYLSKFTEWQIYRHKVLAVIDGQPVPLPFNFNTLYKVFPKNLAMRLENALLKNFEYGKKIPILELKNSNDKDLQFLADFVYEKIFLHYTEKQWNLPPEKIDGAVTARVPVSISRDDGYFTDKFQAVPKHGYAAMIQKMLNHKNIKLMLNTAFNEVAEIKDGKIYLFDSEFKGKIFYTGQLDELFNYKFGALEYRSVDMKFETVDAEKFQTAATVNYPDNYDFTRITEFKHIHPAKSARTTILKEYPQNYQVGKNDPYYPVFTDAAKNSHAKYLNELKNFPQIIPVGRLAEYRYFDMDDAVKNALEIYAVAK